MGSSPSKPEDVVSIHYEHKTAEKVFKAGVEVAKTIVDNLKLITDTIPGPAALLAKCISGLVVAVIDDQLAEEKLDMKEVLKKMKILIHEELTDVEVDKIQGVVEGTKRWIKIEFADRLKAHWDGKELYREYYDKVEELRAVIDTLMEKRFRDSGLVVFVLAASLHLSMLLDVARLDYRAHKWTASAHLADYKKRTHLYADHAEKTLEEVLQKRADKVEHHQEQQSGGSSMDPRLPHVVPQSYYSAYWKDELTGQYGETVLSTDDDDGYDRRIKAVREQLDEDLGRPEKTAQEWRSALNEIPRQ